MNSYKKLLHNLENEKWRFVHVTSEQTKCEFKRKAKKKKSRPFRVQEKGGHRHDYRCKMSGDELSFLNENDQKKLMDDQREVNEHRNLSLKVFQIKKEF